ncbi:hypothetical protein D3C81_1265670 [compost metagenome]
MGLVDGLGGLHRAPEGQPGLQQLRVQQFGGERGAKEPREPRTRAGPGFVYGIAQQLHHPPGDGQVGLGHQLVLARVMMVDQPHRNPRLGADLADRRALETMALEADEGRFDQVGLAQLGVQPGVAHILGRHADSSCGERRI